MDGLEIFLIGIMLGATTTVVGLVLCAEVLSFARRRKPDPLDGAIVLPFRRKRPRANSARFRGGL